MLTNHADLVQTLDGAGQGQVYAFYPELSSAQKKILDDQVASLDWNLVAKLIDTVVKHQEKFELKGDVQPAPYYENKPADAAKQKKYQEAFARGEQLLKEGQIAAFVVAGGQGTRLGWDGPKGTFPATPIKKKPLFQCFAEYLLAMGNRYGKPIPFYIMTSPMNDGPTRAFWKQHNHFGMDRANVIFFPQDSMPAIGFDGKVLLESKGTLALSPNGHGGSLLALYKSGAIADMKRRGITQISYFQVDNPIVRCVDPQFLGLHDLDAAQMSSKMLPKLFPKEKLGNFCLVDGKMTVIEYSDLPDELAEQRLPNGELRFKAGSIALHAIRVDFVESLNKKEGGPSFALPFHRAEKKVPYVDLKSGQLVKPEKANAIKLETFVFDALPLTETSIIYETDRGDEFAPIKQPEGVDSVASSCEITVQRNANWLELGGITVPHRGDGKPDAVIELASSFALYAADVSGKKSRVPPLSSGDQLYLE